MDTREEYLSAAYSAIEEHYDSVETYLREELGLGDAERELLKARYTE